MHKIHSHHLAREEDTTFRSQHDTGGSIESIEEQQGRTVRGHASHSYFSIPMDGIPVLAIVFELGSQTRT